MDVAAFLKVNRMISFRFPIGCIISVIASWTSG